MWFGYVLFARSGQQLPAAEIPPCPQESGPNVTTAFGPAAFITALSMSCLRTTFSRRCHLAYLQTPQQRCWFGESQNNPHRVAVLNQGQL